MGKLAIEINDLRCSYWYNETKREALDGLYLRVNIGDFLVVAGPNGAGKTSLLGCISGAIPRIIDAEVTGQVLANNRPVSELSISELARTMGIVLQDAESQLFGSIARHYMAFGLELMGYERDETLKRIEHAARLMGVNELLDRPCTSLSGGEKQRLVVASVLVLEPSILILDEPTSQLDPLGVRQLISTLHMLNRDFNMTIIMTTHNLSEVSEAATHLIILDHGHIRANGLFREVILEEYQNLVRYPQTAELYHACRTTGLISNTQCPLTVPEGTKFLRRLFLKMEEANL